ncbi:Thiamine-phosphate synthase [Candidatus Gugararchaeum adminiculabundum]|nr:Thiamine-phosphate synthase [Candidatus Gugararchaeum adminiculabundum]
MSSARPKLDFDFYFVTDRKVSRQGDLADVRAALAAGCRIIQYREKDLATREIYSTALELAKLCKSHKAFFIVNDRVDIALAVGADGVHLGRKDLPYATARALLGKEKIIGISANSLAGALEAQKSGADYVSASPVFFTQTKSDLDKPGGVALVKQFSQNLKISFTCIGGINLANLDQVLDAGARSVCAITATVGSDDVEGAVRAFRQKILLKKLG